MPILLLFSFLLLSWNQTSVLAFELPDNDLDLSSVEKKLITSLMKDYERYGKVGRPVKSHLDVIDVEFGLKLSQILGLDETTQILTINSWTKYLWIDLLLRWNPKNHMGIEEIRIPPDKVWTPDIVLYNYSDERLKEQRDVMVTVDYNGRVFWSPPAIFKSTCQIDITYFPFDTQSCFLRFASWTNNFENLNLISFENEKEIDTSAFTDSHQWNLMAKPVRRFWISNSNRSSLTFFLLLKRNYAFYAYTLVLPCVLLSFLNLVIFWLPPTVPAKMILGMNIFVAFSLLLRILAKSTPTASINVPLLGYYYCLNMVLISLSTFFSIIVINLHFRSDKRNSLPDGIIKIVIKMAKWMKIECNLTMPVKKRPIPIVQSQTQQQQLILEQTGEREDSEQMTPNGISKNTSETLKTPNTTAKKQTTQQLESNLSEIRKALQNLVTKMENKDKLAKKSKEWRTVALVLDRSFFCFYLCVIILSGLIMLIPRSDLQTADDVINKYIQMVGIKEELMNNSAIRFIPGTSKNA